MVLVWIINYMAPPFINTIHLTTTRQLGKCYLSMIHGINKLIKK